MSLNDTLSAGLLELGITLDQKTQERLLQYIALLEKWTGVYNLTAVREQSKMIGHHLLDSLAVLPYINANRLIDVGSGAGLPGIPLALARPEMHVTLLDSNHKKTTFLQQACIELKLDNVSVISERVEAFHPPLGFDAVISRAFTDLSEFVKLTRHLLKPGGAWLAMKGLHPYEELAQLPQEVRVEQVIPLAVPGLDAKRHLIIIREA